MVSAAVRHIYMSLGFKRLSSKHSGRAVQNRKETVVDNRTYWTLFGPSVSAAFLKLWSADHKWSSGSAPVVLLD